MLRRSPGVDVTTALDGISIGVTSADTAAAAAAAITPW